MVVVASSKLGKQKKKNISFLGEGVYCKKNEWQ